MKRYDIGPAEVENDGWYLRLEESDRGFWVRHSDAMAEIGSLQAEINRLNKALKSATCEIGWLKADAGGGMISND